MEERFIVSGLHTEQCFLDTSLVSILLRDPNRWTVVIGIQTKTLWAGTTHPCPFTLLTPLINTNGLNNRINAIPPAACFEPNSFFGDIHTQVVDLQENIDLLTEKNQAKQEVNNWRPSPRFPHTHTVALHSR